MKTKIYLFVIIQLFVLNVRAQSLGESLGGVKTNFEFFSDTAKWQVSNQMIIERAEKKSSVDFTGQYAWGHAYQSFHLEFVTEGRYTIKKVKQKNYRDKLELTFYDKENTALASYLLNFSVVDLTYNLYADKIKFFYSIDLLGIPIVLLDQTAKINMIKIVSSK